MNPDFFKLYFLKPLFILGNGIKSKISKDTIGESWIQCAGSKGCGYVDVRKEFWYRHQNPYKCPNCEKTFTFLCIPKEAKEKILLIKGCMHA